MRPLLLPVHPFRKTLSRPGLVLIILGWFLLFEGRFYYLLPIYPMFLAAGAVFLERRLQHYPAWKYTTLIALIASGLVLLPIALPILPIKPLIRYSNTIYHLPPSLNLLRITLPKPLGIFG